MTRTAVGATTQTAIRPSFFAYTEGLSDAQRVFRLGDNVSGIRLKLDDLFLAPRVSLVACGAYKRVCHTCCDPVDCTQLVRLEDQGEAPVLPFCPRRPC